jgi:hypothetical protein
MSDFVYIRSRLDFGHLSNGDCFVGIQPSEYIGKPVDIEFRNSSPQDTVGYVLDAYSNEEAKRFDTFIGPYYPNGFGSVEILVAIDPKTAASLKIQETNNVTLGCSGFQEDEDSKLKITGVSLIRTNRGE